MYRVKLKNKTSEEEILAWEYYNRNNKEFELYSDIELTDKLDSSQYEDITPNNGDGTPFDMFGVECNEGWFSLISPIINYIDSYNKNNPTEEPIRIIQIKEKWAALYIYVSYYTDELKKLIKAAENESQNVCELCGTRENIGTTQNYYMTVCHNCCKKMAIDHGYSYKWYNNNDKKLYLISPCEEDEVIELTGKNDKKLT